MTETQMDIAGQDDFDRKRAMYRRIQLRRSVPGTPPRVVLDELYEEAKKAGYTDIMQAIQIARRSDQMRRHDH